LILVSEKVSVGLWAISQLLGEALRILVSCKCLK